MRFATLALSLCLVCPLPVALSAEEAGPRRLEIVAHRGASYDAPENTVAALNLGWKQGADANELDIRQTKDGRIVALHDETTKRTAGIDRPVAQQTLAELNQLDAGSWKGPQWAGEKIPTLAQTLENVPPGKRVFIEIKSAATILPELERVLADSKQPDASLVLIGFNYKTMSEAKRRFPSLKVYWVVDYKPPRGSQQLPDLDELAERAKAAEMDGLDLNYRFPLDAAAVSRLKEQGLGVYVWTVDDPDVARRLADAGVEGITTNRPAWLRGKLAETCETMR